MNVLVVILINLFKDFQVHSPVDLKRKENNNLDGYSEGSRHKSYFENN